ncbi:hypothetical protein [Calidithermus terrae]|uniref:hypothetical protein n=1 Tax=Calidithermus terrae TaxID=1408545 RepID=UPI000E654ABF|nr:hypothetical protein [Calidithermus terrae]
MAQLRAVLWGMLLEAEAIARDAGQDVHARLKAISALATTAGAYLKATEQADLEARVQALEAALQQQPRMRKVL